MTADRGGECPADVLTKKLAFGTEVAKGLPYGLGDEQHLTQVLLNLVGNAIKFTDAGEVCITAGAENGRFALSVSDTGPGIPAEERENIFEKFRQVDSSNTRAKGRLRRGVQAEAERQRLLRVGLQAARLSPRDATEFGPLSLMKGH